MMLCPHVGRGKRDLTKLKEFLSELKERDEQDFLLEDNYQ